jgi:hypothetical protein
VRCPSRSRREPRSWPPGPRDGPMRRPVRPALLRQRPRPQPSTPSESTPPPPLRTPGRGLAQAARQHQASGKRTGVHSPVGGVCGRASRRVRTATLRVVGQLRRIGPDVGRPGPARRAGRLVVAPIAVVLGALNAQPLPLPYSFSALMSAMTFKPWRPFASGHARSSQKVHSLGAFDATRRGRKSPGRQAPTA